MADYITSANFKTRHGITLATNDARIAAHITAATLEVNSMCGRDFNQHSGAATARYFRPDNCFRVRIDDAYEITAVAVDDADTGAYGTTWATTDYQTLPINGTGINAQTGWPATVIEAIGDYTFPSLRRHAVKVTAKWGWAVTPTDVIEATYLLAHRLYYEVGVPSGVTAPNVEFGLPGSPLQRPYTVERLLHPYIRADRKLGIAG
jgi:hypothetical protein